MPRLFEELDNHIDLQLFEALELPAPPGFLLSRERPGPPELQSRLWEYCLTHERSLKGAARALCADEGVVNATHHDRPPRLPMHPVAR